MSWKFIKFCMLKQLQQQKSAHSFGGTNFLTKWVKIVFENGRPTKCMNTFCNNIKKKKKTAVLPSYQLFGHSETNIFSSLRSRSFETLKGILTRIVGVATQKSKVVQHSILISNRMKRTLFDFCVKQPTILVLSKLWLSDFAMAKIPFSEFLKRICFRDSSPR